MNPIPVTRVRLSGGGKPYTVGYRSIIVWRTMDFRHVKCQILRCTRSSHNEPLAVLRLYNSGYQTVVPFKSRTFFFCIQNKLSDYVLSPMGNWAGIDFTKMCGFFVCTYKFSTFILIDFAQQYTLKDHILVEVIRIVYENITHGMRENFQKNYDF